MVAAGIGITPFRSIIVETIHTQPTRKVALFHSSSTIDRAVFKKEFDMLARIYPQFMPVYFITRQSLNTEGVIGGRVSAAKVIDARAWPQPEYMICGPEFFTRKLRSDLLSAAIPEDAIHTETIFSPGRGTSCLYD
jgi:ferredoxin-NADP reductase